MAYLIETRLPIPLFTVPPYRMGCTKGAVWVGTPKDGTAKGLKFGCWKNGEGLGA